MDRERETAMKSEMIREGDRGRSGGWGVGCPGEGSAGKERTGVGYRKRKEAVNQIIQSTLLRFS